MESKKDLHREEKLALTVRMHPCIYDKSCKHYKDKDARQNAWKAVAREMGFTSESNVEAQWVNLRTRFTRQRKIFKKALGNVKSPSEAQELRGNFEIYHMLSWLDEFVLSRKRFMQINDQVDKIESPTDQRLEEEFPILHVEAEAKSEHMQDEEMFLDNRGRLSNANSQGTEDFISSEKKRPAIASIINNMKKKAHRKLEESTPHVAAGNREEPARETKHLTHHNTSLNVKPGNLSIKENSDENDLFGALIASQLKGLAEHHRLQAKHQINNVMFQIQMQQLGSAPQLAPQVSIVNNSCCPEDTNEHCPCNQEAQYANTSSCYNSNNTFVRVIDDQPHNSSTKDGPSSTSSGSPTPTCVEYSRQGYIYRRQKPESS